MILLELIFSIVLFSIIAFITSDISLNLYKKNSDRVYQTFTNLKLETTRLFLVKNGFTNVQYSDNSLYNGTDLLLDNISLYHYSKSGTIATVDICIDGNTICQQWKIEI